MQDLDEVCADIFRRLARGVADRRSPWRTPVLATTSLDGRPQARTVVLRAFDASSRQITIHSDVRADKVAELRVKPAACAYFWDPSAQVQLRASGPASLLEGEAVRPEWDRLHPGSRMSYRAKPAPGSSLADPACLDLLPEAEAFRHFVVIRMEIQRLDWLRLSRDGQRRAAFDWKQGFIQTWLVP